jgi:hypothetical protein
MQNVFPLSGLDAIVPDIEIANLQQRGKLLHLQSESLHRYCVVFKSYAVLRPWQNLWHFKRVQTTIRFYPKLTHSRLGVFFGGCLVSPSFRLSLC